MAQQEVAAKHLRTLDLHSASTGRIRAARSRERAAHCTLAAAAAAAREGAAARKRATAVAAAAAEAEQKRRAGMQRHSTAPAKLASLYQGTLRGATRSLSSSAFCAQEQYFWALAAGRGKGHMQLKCPMRQGAGLQTERQRGWAHRRSCSGPELRTAGR